MIRVRRGAIAALTGAIFCVTIGSVVLASDPAEFPEERLLPFWQARGSAKLIYGIVGKASSDLANTRDALDGSNEVYRVKSAGPVDATSADAPLERKLREIGDRRAGADEDDDVSVSLAPDFERRLDALAKHPGIAAELRRRSAPTEGLDAYFVRPAFAAWLARDEASRPPSAEAFLKTLEIIMKSKLREEHPRCERRRAYLGAAVASARPLPELLAGFREHSLILLGDAHTLDTTYPDLVETMKSALPRLDCVFLEAGTDEQGAIDRIANLQKPGCPPLDDDFSKILQLEDKLRAEGVITTSRNVAPKTFGPMILRAKSLGIRVYAIDKPGMEYAAGLKDIDGRNHFMAARIRERMKGCHQAFAINGSAHLTRVGSSSTTTLVSELGGRGNRTASILLENTGYSMSGTPDAVWHWPLCLRNLETPDTAGRTPRAFRPAPAPEGVTLTQGGLGAWTDFDAVVLY